MIDLEYNRKLILEDGEEYVGSAFGYTGEKVLELVFNTSMVGYQEILSDPSYTDQAVIMTYLWSTDGASALEEKSYRVIKIESQEQAKKARLRVAAYTRVSSDSEDQLNSFAAQNRYYTELISKKPEWTMVDIYADEGITGTSTKKRDDFQRMMADFRRGLVDQILVKSISRFARNTKECLENVRELKELGINVRFERESINTANVSSELITAIYAAFAQKESESISGNMHWSYQRRMESGTFLPSSMAYGYKIVNKKN